MAYKRFFATGGTATKEFEAMAFDGEIGQATYPRELLLAQACLYLGNLAADRAGSMMMVAPIQAGTEAMCPVCELYAVQQPQFLQDLDRAKDSRPPNGRIALKEHIPQLLDREIGASRLYQEQGQGFPRISDAQTPLLEGIEDRLSSEGCVHWVSSLVFY